MKLYKVFLFVLPLVMCGNVFGAGMSNKTDYGKDLQNTVSSENTEIKKLQKRKPRRLSLNEELNFTEQQKKIVEQIINNSRPKIDEQIKIIDAAYDEIENIHNQDMEQIRKILNPQQQIKLDKIRYKKLKSAKDKKSAGKPSRKRIRPLPNTL